MQIEGVPDLRLFVRDPNLIAGAYEVKSTKDARLIDKFIGFSTGCSVSIAIGSNRTKLPRFHKLYSKSQIEQCNYRESQYG